MVLLTSVTDSNAQLSTLPSGLVAVFIGATAGIGEITLKKFAQHARKPRAYLIGRSQSAADRIIASCRQLNGEGEYIFIKADVSLMENVDEVCEVIKRKEKSINILFMTAGLPVLDGSGRQINKARNRKWKSC
jgi:NADP-dependent 3-hydroxy acid dehydrogenase YdfG